VARYAQLILPSANRVYADAAIGLGAAELAAFSDAVLGGALSAAVATEIGGVPYLEFAAEALGPLETSFLANVSSMYALFELVGGLLRPLDLHRLDRYDDDLITIQKYQGKTNEQFTKLLLNVTLLASAFASEMLDRKLAVLDPLCGRGTTLNQALMYGYDAAGRPCPAPARPADGRRAGVGEPAAARRDTRHRLEYLRRAARAGRGDPHECRPGAGRDRAVPAVQAPGRSGDLARRPCGA